MIIVCFCGIFWPVCDVIVCGHLQNGCIASSKRNYLHFSGCECGCVWKMHKYVFGNREAFESWAMLLMYDQNDRTDSLWKFLRFNFLNVDVFFFFFAFRFYRCIVFFLFKWEYLSKDILNQLSILQITSKLICSNCS